VKILKLYKNVEKHETKIYKKKKLEKYQYFLK